MQLPGEISCDSFDDISLQGVRTPQGALDEGAKAEMGVLIAYLAGRGNPDL